MKPSALLILFNTLVQSDVHLLSNLDEEALRDACSLFNIQREWLDGADKQIYPTYDFYKDPNGFSHFIEKLTSDSDCSVSGVLFSPIEKKLDEALLVLEQTIGYIEHKPYYRYYLLNNWSFSYWKSRAYLTSCIAQCWARKVLVQGISVPGKFIESISNGEVLLSFGKEGFSHQNAKKWYPEDMALLPEAFLRGIDPEINKYGFHAGLQLWLSLESQGHMRSGLENENTRQIFVQEYEKYVSTRCLTPFLAVRLVKSTDSRVFEMYVTVEMLRCCKVTKNTLNQGKRLF